MPSATMPASPPMSRSSVPGQKMPTSTKGTAQHQMPGRDALGRQQQRSPGGQGPGQGHTGGAPPAGNKADPQPVAGQGERRAGLHILHLTGRGHGIPVKQQYPTPQINKMLFYITK